MVEVLLRSGARKRYALDVFAARSAASGFDSTGPEYALEIGLIADAIPQCRKANAAIQLKSATVRRPSCSRVGVRRGLSALQETRILLYFAGLSGIPARKPGRNR
jgi:hypothetical protein